MLNVSKLLMTGVVRFVSLIIFQIASNTKVLVISVQSHILSKSPKQIFASITKKIVFFRHVLKIFWKYLIFLG